MPILLSNISGNFYRFFLISFRTQLVHSKTIITPEHLFYISPWSLLWIYESPPTFYFHFTHIFHGSNGWYWFSYVTHTIQLLSYENKTKKESDFHWNVVEPWTSVGAFCNCESSSGGGTLQVHIVVEADEWHLIYRPEDVLENFKSHVFSCGSKPWGSNPVTISTLLRFRIVGFARIFIYAVFKC